MTNLASLFITNRRVPTRYILGNTGKVDPLFKKNLQNLVTWPEVKDLLEMIYKPQEKVQARAVTDYTPHIRSHVRPWPFTVPTKVNDFINLGAQLTALEAIMDKPSSDFAPSTDQHRMLYSLIIYHITSAPPVAILQVMIPLAEVCIFELR